MAAAYPRQFTLWLTIATCVVNCVVVLIWNQHPHESTQKYSYKGHDFPETLPIPNGKFEHVLLTVEESMRYTLAGTDSDAQWEYLTPRAGGFLSLGPNDQMFLVAMFHQIHCLRFFNWAFDPKFEGLYRSFASKGHNAHCLNYLRQATLCSADLTLEKGDFQKRNFSVDRVGATHTCRDWSAVFDIMEVNLNTRQRIGIEHD